MFVFLKRSVRWYPDGADLADKFKSGSVFEIIDLVDRDYVEKAYSVTTKKYYSGLGYLKDIFEEI